jgi:MFS family permease
MTPFLAAHALAATGKPKSYLGVFVTTQVVGTIGGNLVASRLGDRYGGWAVVNLSRWLLLGACLLVMAARGILGFEAAFLLYGAGATLNMVGMSALHMEACPAARRPTYLAILAAVNVPALLLAAAGSAFLRHMTDSIVPAAAVAMVCILVSFSHLRRLRHFSRALPPLAPPV